MGSILSLLMNDASMGNSLNKVEQKTFRPSASAGKVITKYENL